MRNLSLLKTAIFGLMIASSAVFGVTPSITVGDGAGQPNTDVTINVAFENTVGGDVVAFQFDIQYNSTNLTPDITQCGAGLAAIQCANPSAGTVRVIGDGSLQTIASGSLGTIDFTITDNAALIGTTETLTVANDLFSDDQGDPVTAGTLTNGTITIQAAPAPSISVTPATQAFTAANGSTDTKTITVTNDGDADGLLVTSVDISGANETNFSLVGTTNCPGVAPGLAQSATCTVTVQFAPDSIANFTAQLDIVSNAGTENITLTGTGTAGPAGEITITPAGPFDFGELLTGIEEETQVFTATNTGAPGSVVTISGAALNLLFGSPLSIVANTCTNGTELEKDESCLVTVKEAPIATGTAERTLTVTGADANSTALSDSVTIKGEGIEEARPTSNPAAGTSAASQSEIVGPEGSNDFTVVWGNAGNVSYDLSCALSGSDTSNVWSLADATATVAADGSHTVTTTCALPDTETYTETLTCTVTKPDQETLTYTHNYECVGLPPLPVPVDNKWALALLALMMLMAASFGFRLIARQ